MRNKLLKAQRTRWLIILLALVITAGGFGAAVLIRSDTVGTAPSDLPTFTVQEGPLTISVTESGTISASEQEIIKSEVEGQTTIIYLIPEGTLVKEGQLLVQLDSSRLEDDRVDQQIRVQNAEASFIRASENLEVVKNQALSDTAKAALDFRFAQEDEKQYLDGEYPKQLKEAQSKITLTVHSN